MMGGRHMSRSTLTAGSVYRSGLCVAMVKGGEA